LRRREFIATAAASAWAQDRPRPNILWISCEDMSPFLGCYGDRFAISPSIDRLASQGVRYTRAFTVAGVCAPSRSGIITGMYPSTLGSQHMRSSIRLPEHVRCFPEYLRKAGYYCTNNAKTDYNFPVPKDAWDESSRSAHWRNRKPGQPFFGVFNIETTHESRILMRGEQYAKQTARLTAGQRQDPKKFTLPPYYPDTPEVRRDWANDYELITAMDYQTGDRLKELEEAGLAEDTIVFFWSDHGIGLPRAKRWLYDSGTRAALIARVPQKLRAGGQARPGSTDDQLVSFIDLAPTMLNLAGVPIPGHMQGRAFLGDRLTAPREYIYGARDRMDERYDVIRAVRDSRFRYIRNYEPHKPYYQYMNTPEQGPTMKELRRVHAGGKLPEPARQFMADHKPAEELYDLESDPHEVRNLAGSTAHKEVLNRMRAAHRRWVIETRDTGLLPEPELMKREKEYGSRYAILRQPNGEALLKRLLAVLESPTPASMLNDEDPAVRYWAAIRVRDERVRPLLKDPSSSVRIAAGRIGAVEVLESELQSPDETVRLLAANALDELGERARPALPSLKAALNDGNRYVVRTVNHAVNKLTGATNAVP
jgi:uncharacterized sulfatase